MSLFKLMKENVVIQFRKLALALGLMTYIQSFAVRAGELFPPDSETRWAMPPGVGSQQNELSCGSYIGAESGMPLGKGKSAIWPDFGTFYSENIVLDQWIRGFVTGVNMARADWTKQIRADPDGIILWIRNYCASHPTQTLMTAAVEMVRQNLSSH